ncbi:MAG: hypothetical protein PHW79_08010 [Candidatus Marinimicrobia bacterium]|nr:hypothetical protein [Candidatus Neomarinimicrobiota bacterium]
MVSKDYVPQNELELSKWSANFAVQFATVGPALGFTAEEVTATASACTGIGTSIVESDAAKLEFEKKVTVKKTTIETSTTSIREIVRRVKVAPGYTEEIGKALGIIAGGSSFDPATAAPVITLVKGSAGWDFKYNLHSYFTGVVVYRKKAGESVFTKVDVDLKPPYTVPATTEPGTEFYFQYLKNDQVMGYPSDIIVV